MKNARPSSAVPSFRLSARLVPCLALLLLLALSAAATAQQAPPAEPSAAQPLDVFGEVIEVRVVNVEVVVTDRDGNRVIGLGPEDFRLTVDGDEVPIDFFSAVVGGRAVEPEAKEGTAAVPGIPLAVPGESVGTNYLVFIDDYWSVARDRNRVLQQMTDDLGFLGPDDRMAVVAFDGKQVEMLTSWTHSQGQLERVFSDAQARKSSGLQRLSDLRIHDRALFGSRTARSTDTIQELNAEQRVFADQVASKVERSVSAAIATLRGFAQPTGRKVMLLLSGGWPFSPAAYAVGNRSIVETGQVPSGDELLAPLVNAANLIGYTLYPVDLPGLGESSGVGVEQGGQLITGVRVNTEDQFAGLSSSVVIDRESNLEDTLRYVAQETGGEALINARGLEALSAAAQDTRSYYWLGFSPQRQRDDRRHDVRVQVTRPGLQARTRDSYLDMSRQAERTMAVESALLFGDPAAEGSLKVQLGEPTPAGRRRIDLPLTVAIPVDLLTLLPQGDDWVARVELRVAALDEQNRQSEVPSVPLEFTFHSKPKSGQVVPYSTSIKLRKAEQLLVVSVSDAVEGKSLTARATVSP